MDYGGKGFDATVRAMFAAFAARDVAAVRAPAHPDIVLWAQPTAELVAGPSPTAVTREVAEEGSAVLLLGTIELADEHRATTTPDSWVIEVTGDRVRRVDKYASDSAARAAWNGRS